MAKRKPKANNSPKLEMTVGNHYCIDLGDGPFPAKLVYITNSVTEPFLFIYVHDGGPEEAVCCSKDEVVSAIPNYIDRVCYVAFDRPEDLYLYDTAEQARGSCFEYHGKVRVTSIAED